MPFDDGCISWQWVIAAAARVGCLCWRHCAPQTKEAAWVTSRANISSTMVAGRTRRAGDGNRKDTAGSEYAFYKKLWRGSPRLFGLGLLVGEGFYRQQD